MRRPALHRAAFAAFALAFLFYPASGAFPSPPAGLHLPPQERQAPNIYEDDEIRVLIPPGWTQSSGDPELEPLLRDPATRTLQLDKAGYTLSLAYNVAAPRAAAARRFTEVFALPWLDPAQVDGCSFYFKRSQQPTSEALLFIGLWLDTSNPAERGACAVPADLGRRWLAGYFTVPNGGYFLRSAGPACGQKVFTLIRQAKTPGQLPPSDDPRLLGIIAEAGRIVTTLRYKRCPLLLPTN